MDRGMELRQQGIAGMFGAAFRACLAAKSVFLLITLLSAAYESAFQRYAGLTFTTGNGKTTLQFSFDPSATEQQQVGQLMAAENAEDESLLSRFFPISISFTQLELGQQEKESGLTDLPETAQEAHVESGLVVAKEETVFGLQEDDTKLPSLRIKYVGNDSTANSLLELDDHSLTFYTTRFTGGRRGALDRNTAPTAGLSVVLVALMLVLIILALAFLLVSFQQAAILAILGYSVTSSCMGKPVRLRNAIVSGLKSGIMRLMWLSVLHGIFRGIQCLITGRLLLNKAEDVESLVVRLSTMPLAFLAPWTDKKIIESGMSDQVAAFLAADYFLEALAYAVYIVACWVTILERNYRSLPVFHRSWTLLMNMAWLGIVIKLFESVICGRTSKSLVEKALGAYASSFIIVGVEVYMAVVWLMFYFSARSKLEPRFSHRDLEDFLDKVR